MIENLIRIANSVWRGKFFGMITEVPEQPLSYEEERGKPMPSQSHAAAQANLTGEFLRQPEFRVYSEFTLQFEGAPYTPDLSVYHHEPVDWRHDKIRRQDPPLVVVEIASPTQGYQALMEKLDIYFRNGVKSCWMVSPHLKLITIFGLAGEEQNFDSGIARDPRTGLQANVATVFS
jgi:Uma2 family endonuclease